MRLYFSKPGVICATGNNIEDIWDRVSKANQSGIREIEALSSKKFFAAKVEDSFLSPSSARYDMRIIRLESEAISQIQDTIDAAIKKYGNNRVAVCVGSCDNGSEFSLKGHRYYFEKNIFPDNYNLEMQSADYVASYIIERFNIKGPSLTFATACSSSAVAIMKASDLINAGFVDAVVVGGLDIVSDTVLLGFDSLEAVSSEKTNPFSKNRHGITLGDGAAFFVLSKDSFDSKVYLAGFGESADAYHMTSPEPSGSGAEAAMRNALKSAGIEACDIEYLNLHGTGTKLNDLMESKAVSNVFADYSVPCSSTKSETGHTLGAAAALEAAICQKVLESGINSLLPLQSWDCVQDSELPRLNIVDKNNICRNTGKKYVMSNSFAFGGANASLILGLE